ncbi:MAG: quinolinate synthase NadA [Desulfitobacteriaceae bacterium]
MQYTIDEGQFRTLAAEIKKLKEDNKALIVAHYYQRPEIQDVADFVGDSLQLSQLAAKTDAQIIVFCGVHFMAESAAILSPEKIVLLPEERAGCPMAEMVDVEHLKQRKAELPGCQVVCYVNTSAAVKAESDICCTSSNAAQIVESLPKGELLFIPDQNLGSYVAEKTGRQMHYWSGYCNTHDRLTKQDILNARQQYPNAEVIVHPECREEVRREADYIGSTAGMISYAQKSLTQEFIVGTESGILHQFHKACHSKVFYLASEKLVCPNMKATTLSKVRDALKNLTPRITVEEETRLKAKMALDRMLAGS